MEVLRLSSVVARIVTYCALFLLIKALDMIYSKLFENYVVLCTQMMQDSVQIVVVASTHLNIHLLGTALFVSSSPSSGTTEGNVLLAICV